MTCLPSTFHAPSAPCGRGGLPVGALRVVDQVLAHLRRRLHLVGPDTTGAASPVAVAPPIRRRQVRRHLDPDRLVAARRKVRRKRTAPKPGAVAMNSYVPGANDRGLVEVVRRGRGRARSSPGRCRRRGRPAPRSDRRRSGPSAPPGRRRRRGRRERDRRVGLALGLEVRQRVRVGLDAARPARGVVLRRRSGRSRGGRTPPTARSGSRRRSASWSAARFALRASTIVGFVGMSRNASNSSWIQRRLPGHWSTGSVAGARTAPAAHGRSRGTGRCTSPTSARAQLEVDRDPDLAVGVDLGPGDVVADVAEVQRVDLRLDARLGNARSAASSPRSCGCRGPCCRSRTCRPRTGSRRRSARGRSR